MQFKSEYLEHAIEKYNPDHVTEFRKKNAERLFLGPFHLSLNSFAPPDFGNCRNRLRGSEEFQLFSALHFIKYKLKRAWQRPRRYISIYLALRNRAVSANWTSIPSCIEFYCKKFPYSDQVDLMERGHRNLIRAVECFDPWRGFKFSTYGFNSILKGFSSKPCRAIRTTPLNEVLTDTLFNKKKKNTDNLWIDRLQKLLTTSRWSEHEKDILTYRFGCFGYNEKKLTLDNLGKKWSVSKERVRQIQVKTLNKLKQHLVDDKTLH